MSVCHHSTTSKPNFRWFHWFFIVWEQFFKVTLFLSTRRFWLRRWNSQLFEKWVFYKINDFDCLSWNFNLKIWHDNLTLFSYMYTNFQVNIFIFDCLRAVMPGPHFCWSPRIWYFLFNFHIFLRYCIFVYSIIMKHVFIEKKSIKS